MHVVNSKKTDAQIDVEHDGKEYWTFYYKIVLHPAFPYVVHLFALLLVGTLYAHVQITTRLICAASPIIYVGMAHIMTQVPQGQQRDHGPIPSARTLLIVYLVIFNVLGAFLHCNYFPWT